MAWYDDIDWDLVTRLVEDEAEYNEWVMEEENKEKEREETENG